MNIIKTIGDIGQNTKFNGQAVFGSTLTVSVASFSQIGVSVAQISTSGTAALGLTAGTNSLATYGNASTSAGLIASALDSVSSVRATIGATQQQLTAVANSLGIQVENFTSANSQITDANIADEVVNLSKFQILNQSGISALSQATQSNSALLTLLR